MRLLVKVNNVPAYIVGYGPGPNGSPRAICIIEGVLKDFALSEIELMSVPRRLQKMKKKHEGKKAVALVVNAR
jgi:hypothetical protein